MVFFALWCPLTIEEALINTICHWSIKLFILLTLKLTSHISSGNSFLCSKPHLLSINTAIALFYLKGSLSLLKMTF